MFQRKEKTQSVNMGPEVQLSLLKCWPRFSGDPETAAVSSELLRAVSELVTKESFESRQT